VNIASTSKTYVGANRRSQVWEGGWHNAHQFYDLMLEKKSVDAFWEKVLKD